MKYILTFLFLLISFFITAQREVNKTDILRFNKEIDDEIITLKDSLANSKNYVSQIDLEFKLDVYRIEKFASKKINVDNTTMGMTKAIFELEKEYDKLLNKYYQILLKKLKPEDYEKLKMSQRNWISFRDSERALIGIVSQEKYSGGGTIQKNIRASRICEITRKRVYEIKEHIDQFSE
ncbi:lysozyme inhibitor LprI family protein [Tenacibaculum jejuense]|uniref:Lysozyme inhibitor LprI-like N-terminal domain-containing protein n=1 Tax=Tenacibaculum jejuense TaxID=584609 RepID=A0A238U3T9_9FLAO|nr:lysozyme inhibitor LprI family protein [Tenacibaculum jejuense]SNR13873.1 protein of unknown function [Tenacibaculum jejuense]